MYSVLCKYCVHVLNIPMYIIYPSHRRFITLSPLKSFSLPSESLASLERVFKNLSLSRYSHFLVFLHSITAWSLCIGVAVLNLCCHEQGQLFLQSKNVHDNVPFLLINS